MFTMIVAHDANGGIAKDNKIPWSIPQDLKHFKKLTENNVVVMGRKTYDSLPDNYRPLPNRINIVLSKSEQKDSAQSNLFFYNKIDTMIMDFGNKLNTIIKGKKLFVIGGDNIYKQFMQLNLVYKIISTQILKDFNCDKFISCYDILNFNLIQNNSSSKLKLIKSYDLDIINPKCVIREILVKNLEEQQILDIIKDIHLNGCTRMDRTGTGTKSVFGRDSRFDLSNGQFPLMTTRRCTLRLIFEELMWFLSGSTDVKVLENLNINIWTPNSTRAFLDKRGLFQYEPGDIGPSYGFQMRHQGAVYKNCKTDYSGQGYDQLAEVIKLLSSESTMFSRRIMINLWNSTNLDKMALPPCAYCYQFYVKPLNNVSDTNPMRYSLSCKLTQRSSDIMLAGGWNVSTASLLTILLSHILGFEPGEVIWSTGDTHIYINQLDAVTEQVNRVPRPYPHLSLTPIELEQNMSVSDALDKLQKIKFTDLQLTNYNPYKRIKIAMNA
jgi:dihydrofolate reductase/thymidylate synthase